MAVVKNLKVMTMEYCCVFSDLHYREEIAIQTKVNAKELSTLFQGIRERVMLWGTIYKSGINAAFYAKLRHLYKASKIVNFSLTSLPRSECGVESDPDA